MAKALKPLSLNTKEIIFQIVLYTLVFLFYSFDKNDPGVTIAQALTFGSYCAGALFISYYLMPKFLYKKKHWKFFGGVLLTIIILMLIEEMVLEKIFYSGTKRADIFPGIYFVFFDIIPVIAILSGFKFGWDALKKQEQIDELKDAVQESELQYLKSQINPHFLFNNLNNLYSYAIEQSTKTPSIILELSSVLRYMLYDCKENFVALPKEIEHLKNFTQLNQLQIEERGEVIFNTQNIKPEYKIAPLILNVFIENAFKHSTASQSKNIFINIDIKVSDDNILEFECKNSFSPMGNTQSLSKGIGLNNVKKRLEILYPDAHKLDIVTKENTYHVTLRMNLKT
ncbi:histidine kinase [Maribacter sp. MMG018]|uniref:sensor histidine kinase n=1 Tax=Maribacter sp. MMG018 TaxID=2822688 RepID=UPI001B384B3C|nr:histidine kinase [Maribacter sp. MMG018]MBQ4914715.1 histidine kinase [Maribacter sp. MMG018]